MTAAPLDRRALCRGLVSRAVRAMAHGPVDALAAVTDEPSDPAPAETRRAEAERAAGPVPDFFASFDQCHTLIAEMRPFLDDAIRDLGIDPHGKTDVDLAREIMAHQRARPVLPRTPGLDASDPPAPDGAARDPTARDL